MLTEERISKFYEDVKVLGLKRPVAAISEATGFSKGNVSQYLNRKSPPSENFIDKFYEVFKESFKKVPHGTQKEPIGGQASTSGYVPAADMIAVLKEQNEFLRRNFETSLVSIVEGQHQTGIQLKALSWFSALAAAGGDEKKAQDSILAINNKIADYEGVEGGDDTFDDSHRTDSAGKRRQKH